MTLEEKLKEWEEAHKIIEVFVDSMSAESLIAAAKNAEYVDKAYYKNNKDERKYYRIIIKEL